MWLSLGDMLFMLEAAPDAADDMRYQRRVELQQVCKGTGRRLEGAEAQRRATLENLTDVSGEEASARAGLRA